MNEKNEQNDIEIRIFLNLTLLASSQNKVRCPDRKRSVSDFFSNWIKTKMNIDIDDPAYDDNLPFHYHSIREEEE